MTLEEFVSLDPDKIRRDKQLMQLFVDFYKAAFSLEPNCAGCVFKRGFNKLKRYAKKGEKTVTLQKNTTMEKTFIVKAQYRGKILTYKENGVVHRKYGNSLTEEFARKLAEHGKSDVFAKLPESKKKQKAIAVIDRNDIDEAKSTDKEIVLKSKNYDSMDWKDEILPLYAEVRERTGEKAKSRSKNDVIEFIKENENK